MVYPLIVTRPQVRCLSSLRRSHSSSQTNRLLSALVSYPVSNPPAITLACTIAFHGSNSASCLRQRFTGRDGVSTSSARHSNVAAFTPISLAPGIGAARWRRSPRRCLQRAGHQSSPLYITPSGLFRRGLFLSDLLCGIETFIVHFRLPIHSSIRPPLSHPRIPSSSYAVMRPLTHHRRSFPPLSVTSPRPSTLHWPGFRFFLSYPRLCVA